MRKLVIVGYARESTKEQAVNGFNMDDQEKKIRSYVDLYYADEDYSLEIVREEGASGHSLDRPKMQEVLQRIRNKQINVLIIHNLDRLTRQVRDLAALLEDFEKNQVKLISITEKIDTETPMGRFFIYLIVLMAQWEWETIRSRTIRGLEESARQGNYSKAIVPFGYIREPENKHKILISEPEADTVRRIFTDIREKDETVTTLVHKLNQENANNIKWTKSKVRGILDNQIYYGLFVLMGKKYHDHVPAIISKQQYDDAQKKLVVVQARTKYRHLYKRMVVCTKCNIVMSSMSVKNADNVVHIYYRCNSCKSYLNEKSIDNQYSEMFTSIMKREKYALDIEKYKMNFEEISHYIEKIPQELIFKKLGNDYLEILIDRSEEEKKKIDWCIRALQTDISYISFDNLPFTEKRAFLHSHIKQINYDPRCKGLEIEYIERESDQN